MQITRTIGIEALPYESPWDKFWEWWNSLQQWQQVLIILTPIVGTITYLAIRR